MKILSFLSFFALLIVQAQAQPKPQNLQLYHLTDIYIEEQKLGFISMSEQYDFTRAKGQRPIPEGMDSALNINLVGKYRERFLSGTKTKESDYVFIYDYSTEVLISLQVKDLEVVAHANIFASGAARPFNQSDYMIGFAINRERLTDLEEDAYYTLVYVGPENIFLGGKLEPVMWQEMDSTAFPSIPLRREDSIALANCPFHDFYSFEWQGKYYYIQTYWGSGRHVANRLLVLDLRTRETLTDYLYYDSETSSPLPLSYVETDDKMQWTGSLFKGMPPIILGLESRPYGCAGILFLDKKQTQITINCDNRH